MSFLHEDEELFENQKKTSDEIEDDDFIITREASESLEEEIDGQQEPENELQEEENFEENLENNDENEENSEKSSENEQECETEVLEEPKADEGNKYLDMARQIQADFENFRRHSAENVKKAKIDGQASVIEVFLPCLDTFKEAKKSISDENVLKGVEMIEGKINEALKSLGVEKLPSIGQVYDPHIHESLAVMRDESKENDIILEEYQAGYKFNGKVLRYAKVIVNKL